MIVFTDDSQFLRNIPFHCNEYARNLTSILLYCCQNGQQGLDAIYSILAVSVRLFFIDYVILH